MIPDGHTVVNMRSGGGGSWCAERRLIDTYGPGRVTGVFTDVKGADGNPHTGEDADTYRFLRDIETDLGNEFVYLQDGRDIWDIFFMPAVGWLGNSQLAHCSWYLKTLPARNWLDANRDPATTWVSVGMDWTETQRHAGVHRNYAHTVNGCDNPALCSGLFSDDGRAEGPGCKNLLRVPWRVLMPMNDKPRWAKPQVLRLMRERGLEPPRMYAMGFGHANCIACVKAGKAHWLNVLDKFPGTYAYAEKREQEFRASKPQRGEATILTETVDKVKRPLTLTELRERHEGGGQLTFDMQFEWGGCGCSNEEPPPLLQIGGAA